MFHWGIPKLQAVAMIVMSAGSRQDFPPGGQYSSLTAAVAAVSTISSEPVAG